MDVGRAFTFAFEDPDWLKKLLIGGALLLIPIFGWLVVVGYGMRVIRGAYAGNDVPLPRWDQFGDDVILGLKGAVALFIWWLPFLAILITLVCVSLPLWFTSGAGDPSVMVPLIILGAFGSLGFGLGSIIFQVVMLAIQPMVLGRIAVAGDFAAGFQLGAIVREMRRVPVPLLIVMGLEYGIRSVSGFGIIFCFVGVVFTLFGGFVLLSHLYGQLRRVIEHGEAAPAGPAVIA